MHFVQLRLAQLKLVLPMIEIKSKEKTLKYNNHTDLNFIHYFQTVIEKFTAM